MLEEVGHPTRRHAIGRSGKGPIHIAAIQRRAPFRRHYCRHIGERKDRQRARNIGRFNAADQPLKVYLSLVLIAVVSSHKQN